MKFILLLAVLGVALWMFTSRTRIKPPPGRKPPGPAAPATMVACAHCGVHVPQPDALHDAAGRSYCGDAHREAGPR